MPTRPNKSELRAELRAVRRAIASDPTQRAARSARIWASVVPLLDLGASGPGSGSRRAQILLFESLPTEPDTTAWIEWCRSQGMAALFPVVDGDDLRVEPGDVDPATLDAVIVPGLAFTPDGRRLGQGGGHYDRLLARLAPGVVTIGVCFGEQLRDDLPTEPHDQRVDHVITDALEDPTE